MNEGELASCYAALGVQPGVSLPELELAFMKRNFALITRRDSATGEPEPGVEAQRQQLRAAYEQLVEHVRRQPIAPPVSAPPPVTGFPASPPVPTPPPMPPPVPAIGRVPQPAKEAIEEEDRAFALVAFDRLWVNLAIPPLLLGFAYLLNHSPLAFFLRGFHVWVHEFGHATLAWLCGFHALPLPLGWTPVVPVYSPFVHWGLLFLFGVLAWAGWRERQVWPIIAAVALAGLQHVMTWRLSADDQTFWYGGFGGVAGEFVLSTLAMMAFYVRLPEKFRWGACRYVFFLIGASTLLNIWLFWLKVYDGIEEIPFGSMIHGEEDAGGDMNALVDDYGWTKFQIRRTYYLIGQACWLSLGITWLVFALRLNRLPERIVNAVRYRTER